MLSLDNILNIHWCGALKSFPTILLFYIGLLKKWYKIKNQPQREEYEIDYTCYHYYESRVDVVIVVHISLLPYKVASPLHFLYNKINFRIFWPRITLCMEVVCKVLTIVSEWIFAKLAINNFFWFLPYVSFLKTPAWNPKKLHLSPELETSTKAQTPGLQIK